MNMIRIILLVWLCATHPLHAHDLHIDEADAEPHMEAHHTGHGSEQADEHPTHLPRGWALVTGVSVIWALFSTYGWWRARRK